MNANPIPATVTGRLLGCRYGTCGIRPCSGISAGQRPRSHPVDPPLSDPCGPYVRSTFDSATRRSCPESWPDSLLARVDEITQSS